MSGSNKIIQVKNLTKTVPTAAGQLSILTDISVEIEAAQSVAIVGASGSGKSTLLGLLAGLDRPSSGSICFDGKNLDSLDEDALAELRSQSIGFVFLPFCLMLMQLMLETK